MKTNNAVKITLACLITAIAMRGAFEGWCWHVRSQQQLIQTIEAAHAEWTADAPTRPNYDSAQAHVFTYRSNADMPRDAVELDANQAWDAGDFYDDPPAVRPQNVPMTFVLVQVYQRSDGKLHFVGWIFLGADEVNALHGQPPI